MALNIPIGLIGASAKPAGYYSSQPYCLQPAKVFKPIGYQKIIISTILHYNLLDYFLLLAALGGLHTCVTLVAASVDLKIH